MSREYYEFVYDQRLQVNRPLLHVEYDDLPIQAQHTFELKCQEVCALIPPQIKAFEQQYMEKFDRLNQATDDKEFYQLLDEMNELSSRISDLNVLFLHIEGTYIATSMHA